MVNLHKKFIESLLNARNNPKHWGYSTKQKKKTLHYILEQTEDEK